MAATENLVNNFSTTLVADIDASQTVIVVAVQAPAGANFRILVGGELMQVTDNSTLTWTVVRGAESTTAAAHDAGAVVTAVLTADGLNAWLNSNIPPSTPSGPAGGSLAGTYPDPTIANSGVGAGIYGDSTHIGQFNVGLDGRIISAASVAITGAPPAGVAGGSLAGSYPDPTIADSGVAAGSYGDGTHVGAFTVGADGRLTVATSTAITFPAGTVPASPNQSIQFNNAGAFGGSANLTWDGGTVAVNGSLTAQGFVNARGTQGPSTFGSTTPLVNVSGSVGPLAAVLYPNATVSGTYFNRALSTTLLPSVQTGITNSGGHTGHWLEVMRNDAVGIDGNGTLTALIGEQISIGHNNSSAVTPQTTAATGLRISPFALTGLIGTLTAVDVVGSGLLTPNATTVYGLRSGIGASTGWWNLYIDGTAQNAVAGNLRLGGVTPPTVALDVTGSGFVSGTLGVNVTSQQAYETLRVGGTFASGSSGAYSISVTGIVPAGASSIYAGVLVSPSTVASTAFSEFHSFDAGAPTLGSGTTINVSTGFHARDQSTANFGISFRGQTAAGTNKYNLYLDGTAQNYIEGSIGIGISVPAAGIKVHLAGTAPVSAGNSAVIYNGISFPAGTTSTAFSYQSAPLTAASAFTLATLYHYNANNIALGAASAVTTQVGFSAQDLTSATNNYGFQGMVSAGATKFNLYMSGSAKNYMAGQLLLDSASATFDASAKLELESTTQGLLFPRMTTTQRDAISSPAEGLLVYNTSNQTVDFRNATVWAAVGTGATNIAGIARQTVLTGSLSSTGIANAFTTGSGLRPGLSATTTPIVIAFAGGFSSSGAVDLITRLTADVSDILGADLPVRQTSFVAATWVSASSVTWSQTIVPPQYGEYYDRTRNVLCHFEGTNGATTFTDDYGNTAQRVGTDASISTAQFKFGSSSIRLNAGAGASCAEILIDTPITNEGSWTLETYIRFNTLPAASANAGILFAGGSTSGVGMQLYLFNNAGTLNIRTYLSSQNTSFNIASNSPGTKTSWATNTWYHVAITYDVIDGAFYVYVDGVVDNTISSATNWLQFIAKVRAGSSGAITPANVADCWVDEFRYSQCCRYPHGTTFTPGGPFTAEGDFFSIPAMQMFSVTSASASAGTNPGLTAVNKVYTSEFVTGAATISSAITYAYRGRYVGAWTTTLPATSVKTTFNHNLGIKPDKADFVVEWLMTDGSVGYQVADRIKNGGSQNGTYYVETNPVLTRNVGSYATLNSTSAWFIAKAGGTSGGNSVECRYRFEALRGW